MKNLGSVYNTTHAIAAFFLLIGIFFIPISTAGMSLGLLVATLLVLLNGSWREKIIFVKERPALWISLPLFLLVLVGTLHGIAPWHERLLVLKKYCYLVMIPIIACLFIEKNIQKKALFIFLFAILVTWTFSYLMTFFHILFIHSWSRDNHPTSFFQNHISISMLSAFSVFVFAHLFRHTSSQCRYLYLLAALLGSYYVLTISSGRTGYFVFFGLSILFIFQSLHWKGLIFGLILTALLIPALLYTSPTFRLGIDEILQACEHYSYAQSANSSSAGRLESFKIGLNLFQQHPFIGTGTGSFYQASSELAWVKAKHSTGQATTYNDFLFIAAEVGFLGPLLVLLMYTVQWQQKKTLPEFYSQLAELLIITMLIGGLFNPILLDTVEAHFYAIFTALCFSSAHQTNLHKIRHPL